MRPFVFCSVLFVLTACASTREAVTPLCTSHGEDGICRPFRLEVITMDPERNLQKPLAAFNPSGYVIISGILVGALDSEWLVGMSMKERAVKWMVRTDPRVASPVAAFGSWVVVGLRDGRLLKLEAETGKQVWESSLARFSDRDFVLSGSTLLVYCANQQIFALDFLTGKTRWVYDVGGTGDLTMRGGASPAVRNQKVYFGTSAGDLRVLDLESGQLLARIEPGFVESRFHDIVGSLAIENNRVVLSRSDGVVTALDMNSNRGTSLWKEELTSVTTSAFREGVFFVGCLNGHIYALDSGSGRRIWELSTGAPVGAVVPGEKAVYVSSPEGRLTVVDPANGAVIWSDDLAGYVDPRPVVFGDRIYFGTGLRSLYGYQLVGKAI